MEPIISPWIVYLIHTLSIVSFMATLLLIISLIGAVLSGFFIAIDDGYIVSDNMRKAFKICTIVFAVSSLFAILVPNKETMLAMLTLSFVTPDNITLVQDNLIDFIQKVVEACKGVK